MCVGVGVLVWVHSSACVYESACVGVGVGGLVWVHGCECAIGRERMIGHMYNDLLYPWTGIKRLSCFSNHAAKKIAYLK